MCLHLVAACSDVSLILTADVGGTDTLTLTPTLTLTLTLTPIRTCLANTLGCTACTLVRASVFSRLPLARGVAGNASKVCIEFHGKVTCDGSSLSQSKYGVGSLVLQGTRGAVVSGSIRTHLHNATIVARLVTTAGAISFTVFVHAERQLVVVEGLRGVGGEGAGADADADAGVPNQQNANQIIFKSNCMCCWLVLS